MNLKELIEPILSYISVLNSGSEYILKKEVSQIKNEIKYLLANIEKTIKTDKSHLIELYRKIELPLIFFIDYMITESEVPFAEKWCKERLAYEKSILTGDKKFFDIFEQIYKKNEPRYNECLEIIYLFVYMGFTGIYEAQSEYIKDVEYRIMVRLEDHTNSIEEDDKNYPENYQKIYTEKPFRKNNFSFRMIIVIFTLLSLAVFVINFYLFYTTSMPLISTFKQIATYAHSLPIK